MHYQFLNPEKIFFSEWGYWSSCSKSCDSGITTRTRTCSYDSVAFEQSGGKLSEKQSCNTHKCGRSITFLMETLFLFLPSIYSFSGNNHC